MLFESNIHCLERLEIKHNSIIQNIKNPESRIQNIENREFKILFLIPLTLHPYCHCALVTFIYPIKELSIYPTIIITEAKLDILTKMFVIFI